MMVMGSKFVYLILKNKRQQGYNYYQVQCVQERTLYTTYILDIFLMKTTHVYVGVSLEASNQQKLLSTLSGNNLHWLVQIAISKLIKTPVYVDIPNQASF